MEEIAIRKCHQDERQRQADVLRARFKADGAALNVGSTQDESQQVAKAVAKQWQDETGKPQLPWREEHRWVDDAVQNDVDSDGKQSKNASQLRCKKKKKT